MSDEAQTRPTLETLSQQVEEMRSEMRDGFKGLNHMLEQMDIRLDTIESFAHNTHSILLALRASFKSYRAEGEEEPTKRRRGKKRDREKQLA